MKRLSAVLIGNPEQLGVGFVVHHIVEMFHSDYVRLELVIQRHHHILVLLELLHPGFRSEESGVGGFWVVYLPLKVQEVPHSALHREQIVLWGELVSNIVPLCSWTFIVLYYRPIYSIDLLTHLVGGFIHILQPNISQLLW